MWDYFWVDFCSRCGIIFGLIFAVGAMVSQVGAVVAGARWVDVLRHVRKSEFVG